MEWKLNLGFQTIKLSVIDDKGVWWTVLELEFNSKISNFHCESNQMTKFYVPALAWEQGWVSIDTIDCWSILS